MDPPACAAEPDSSRVSNLNGAGASCTMFERTRPGQTALAVTPVPASRGASSKVNIRFATLVAPMAVNGR